jgi:hypothetical protein
MVEGEKRRVWIPEQLAYQGKPGGPQGMLVFEIELEKISEAPPPGMGMHGMPGGMGMHGMGGGIGMGGHPHPPEHPQP